jgi:hypothetical protein
MYIENPINFGYKGNYMFWYGFCTLFRSCDRETIGKFCVVIGLRNIFPCFSFVTLVYIVLFYLQMHLILCHSQGQVFRKREMALDKIYIAVISVLQVLSDAMTSLGEI